jgi:hypothetical protein
MDPAGGFFGAQTSGGSVDQQDGALPSSLQSKGEVLRGAHLNNKQEGG